MMESNDWTFPTLAYVWEYRNGAIVAGAERLDAMSDAQRVRSLDEFYQRVLTMAGRLDDGWLVATASVMVDHIYKSFFRDFVWSPGVHDYLGATAQPVVHELQRRGFVLHYVVDATQGDANLRTMLDYLPAVFRAAGFAVVSPQLAARELCTCTTGQPPDDLAAIQAFRDEGHKIADSVIRQWHAERQSSVYLNIDRDDDLPGLALDVALSQDGKPGTVVVFRDTAPAEGSDVMISPPPGVDFPPETGLRRGRM